MAEITTGWRAILSHPLVYEAIQYLVGAKKFQRDFLNNHVRPKPGEKVLDVGCGPAEILKFLPRMDYVGFDHSTTYIDRARKAFGDRARFYNMGLEKFGELGIEARDLALAVGVLHHIDDGQAARLFDLVADTLAPGGRFFTADPCYYHGQDPLTRFVISQDRGQNIRQFDAYLELARRRFPGARAYRVTGLLPFPHSVCILECRRLVA